MTSKSEFGIKGYVIQKHAFYDKVKHLEKWRVNKSVAGKYTFLDDVMKEAKKKCDSKLYIKPSDWKADAAVVSSHGHIHKDEFKKMKRETLPEEIYRRAKNTKSPAPGAYEVVPKDRTKGAWKVQ